MDAIISHAQAALYDQRTVQPRFREAQLDALFKTLQTNGETLITLLAKDASGITARLEAELAFALTTINQLSNGLPTPSLWWRGQTILPHTVGERQLPAGIVSIEANTHHPILSIIVPLACSIAAGNAAIVTSVSTAGQSFITKLLGKVLDQDLYQFIPALDEKSTVDARIGLATSTSPKRTGQIAYKPAFGPSAVIIDQSCLDGKPLPHPLNNPNYSVPKSLRKAVQDLKDTIAFEAETRSNAPWRSSTSVSYILVHENVLPLFERAIKEQDIASHFKAQSISSGQAILAALPSPTALQYIPVFPCTSLDRAIDFVNNEAPAPTVSYIIANPHFSAYAANQLVGDDVIIGGIPRAIVAQGPYHRISQMKFQKEKSIELASTISRHALQLSWKELTAKQIKRKADSRIDFFFSGILLSFGITASAILGLSGLGAYKAILLATQYIKHARSA